MLQSPHHLQTYPLSFLPMETRWPTNVFARTLSSPAGSDYLHQPNMGPPPTHHPPVGPGAAFKQLGLSPYLNGFCPCGAWGFAALGAVDLLASDWALAASGLHGSSCSGTVWLWFVFVGCCCFLVPIGLSLVGWASASYCGRLEGLWGSRNAVYQRELQGLKIGGLGQRRAGGWIGEDGGAHLLLFTCWHSKTT